MAIEAKDFIFMPSVIEAPAGRPVSLVFTNSDGSIPHNVDIRAGGTTVFSGKLVNGVATVTYSVPALEAGTYSLSCIVHPAMTGTLVAR